jgi:hypothetical protein
LKAKGCFLQLRLGMTGFAPRRFSSPRSWALS